MVLQNADVDLAPSKMSSVAETEMSAEVKLTVSAETVAVEAENAAVKSEVEAVAKLSFVPGEAGKSDGAEISDAARIAGIKRQVR